MAITDDGMVWFIVSAVLFTLLVIICVLLIVVYKKYHSLSTLLSNATLELQNVTSKHSALVTGTDALNHGLTSHLLSQSNFTGSTDRRGGAYSRIYGNSRF